MTELEQLKAWLEGCALFRCLPIRLDALGKAPKCAALRSEGITEVWRREDILGTWLSRYRLKCKLQARLFYPANTDGGENAKAWLDLQQWVQSHPAPALGEEQRTKLENGRLSASAGDGTAVYEATLTVEYTLPERESTS